MYNNKDMSDLFYIYLYRQLVNKISFFKPIHYIRFK